MGMTVKLTAPQMSSREFMAAVRQAEVDAAHFMMDEVIKGTPVSMPDAGSVGHEVDTAFVVADPSEADVMQIGLSAPYSVEQEIRDYHHERGRAHNLELTIVEKADAWKRELAKGITERVFT